jgi:hypothetical protein
MRIIILALIAVALGLSAATTVSAAEMGHCSHEPTIAALRSCVQHAIDHDHIDNPGVGRSLLAKLDSAQRSADRSQPAVAINKLEAFIHELDAQAGAHIETEHAAHMRTHAQEVIVALSQ